MNLNNSLLIWISFKFMQLKNPLKMNFATQLSFLGLALGVACLVVSMAVISGFERTLQKSVAEVTGHIRVIKLNSDPESAEQLIKKIKQVDKSVEAASAFVFSEAVLAHDGKISGIMLQGVDLSKIDEVLNFKGRMISGELGSDPQLAYIGKGIADNFKVKVGDTIKVVLPMMSDLDPQKFKRKIGSFKVGGVLDLGKHEYNERLIVVGIQNLQELAEIKDRYTGILLKLDDVEKARDVSFELMKNLGSSYRVNDWKEVNENLFEAVKIERVVIFFIILIIIIAASFNVASSLYIHVVKKYSDIGILKSMGVSSKQIIQIFNFQGVIMGLIGLSMGLVLGLIFCVAFSVLQNQFGLIQGSIYRIDHIDIYIRFVDILAISVATVFICFVATLAPAYIGSKLNIIEGIRHD